MTAGRLVLARARWRLSAAEVGAVTGTDAVAGWAALIRDRGFPGELLIADGDNRLYVDTASPALTATAAKVLRGRTEAVVEEVLPTGVGTGPQGRFANESHRAVHPPRRYRTGATTLAATSGAAFVRPRQPVAVREGVHRYRIR